MKQGKYERYMHSRRNGFGMNLYRNTRRKKIGGVCAGLADHFEIDHTIMRLIFIALLIFTGAIAVWAYVIAWIVLKPKHVKTEQWDEKSHAAYEYDEDERRYRKKKMFRYRESTSERLNRAKSRLDKVIQRVDDMEHYVTSKKFNLNRQFADLEK